MTDGEPRVIARLDELIELCKEGYASFERAAQLEADPGVRATLGRCALQHARFLHELQREVLDLGGDPTLSAHDVRPLHRNWIALRAALRPRDAATLAGCAGCEDQVLLAYADTISIELPPRVYALLRRQQLELALTHDTLHALAAARARAAG